MKKKTKKTTATPPTTGDVDVGTAPPSYWAGGEIAVILKHDPEARFRVMRERFGDWSPWKRRGFMDAHTGFLQDLIDGVN